MESYSSCQCEEQDIPMFNSSSENSTKDRQTSELENDLGTTQDQRLCKKQINKQNRIHRKTQINKKKLVQQKKGSEENSNVFNSKFKSLEKKEKLKLKNRVAAQKSRDKKKNELEQMKLQIKLQFEQIAQQKQEIRFLNEKNQQLINQNQQYQEELNKIKQTQDFLNNQDKHDLNQPELQDKFSNNEYILTNDQSDLSQQFFHQDSSSYYQRQHEELPSFFTNFFKSTLLIVMLFLILSDNHVQFIIGNKNPTAKKVVNTILYNTNSYIQMNNDQFQIEHFSEPYLNQPLYNPFNYTQFANITQIFNELEDNNINQSTLYAKINQSVLSIKSQVCQSKEIIMI